MAFDGPSADNVREARSQVCVCIAVLLIGLVLLGASVPPPLTFAVVAPDVAKMGQSRRPGPPAEGGVVREVQVRMAQRLSEGQTKLTVRAASMVRSAGQQPALDLVRRARRRGGRLKHGYTLCHWGRLCASWECILGVSSFDIS